MPFLKIQNGAKKNSFAGQPPGWRKRGERSPAWRGEMVHNHPYQAHLFDGETFRSSDGKRNIAVERLYFKTTVRNPDEILPGERVVHDFNSETRAYFLKECASYVSRVAQQDADALLGGEMDATAFERYELQHLPQRVQEYFTEYYVKAFQQYNLFGLLEIGLGARDRQRMESILIVHVQRMRQLINEQIVHEESLSERAPEGLDQTLYLGINMQDGTTDAHILNDALRRLGSLTRRPLSPRVEHLDDPHRLQVLYGLHGISLSHISALSRTQTGMMAEYLRHQGQWMGSGYSMHDAARRPWGTYPQDPDWTHYGQNQMPVHASGEMEQLVLDPSALEYEGPCSSYGPSVLGRVIREG